MPVFKAATAAFRRGGVGEVVKLGRRRLVRVIHPDPVQASSPRAARRASPAARPNSSPRKSEPVRHFAQSVTHEQALAWFESRRAGYERMADVLAPYLEPNGVLFDVGANVGYFTKIVGERLHFTGTAHLFEPVPNLAQLCRITVRLLPFKTEVHEFGLGDADSTLEIFLAADGNLGWNTLVAGRASADMTPLTVSIRTLESAGVLDRPSVIKVDVEGAEYLVLRGMLPSLSRWDPQPVILCEIGFGQSHPAWAEEIAVFAALSELGYRCVDLSGRPVAPAQLTKTTDVLFLPEDRKLPPSDARP